MRFAAKMTLWACAAPAVAALLLTGAGAANAAVAAPAALSGAAHGPHGPGGPGPGPHCNWWQLERWNVNGYNTVELKFGTGNFTYAVHFKQNGSCLGGTLTDTGLPSGSQVRTISGTVNGSYITFSVPYPGAPGGIWGVRTFSGNINKHGDVRGTWSETGTEHGSGTWTLAYNAHSACSHYYWWDPQRECHVFS
jgi:hypothetical protein